MLYTINRLETWFTDGKLQYSTDTCKTAKTYTFKKSTAIAYT